MPPQSPSASGLMQAAQRGAPWANEVVNTGSLRRQIVSQVQNAEANAEQARRDEEAREHRESVQAARKHKELVDNLTETMGSVATTVAANKFLGKMKTVVSDDPMEAKLKLRDIAAVKEAEEAELLEQQLSSMSAEERSAWEKARAVKTGVVLSGKASKTKRRRRRSPRKGKRSVTTSAAEGALAQARSRRGGRTKMQRYFNRVDQDGSGQLDREETAQLLSLMGVAAGSSALEAALYALDPNDDGKVSYAEFKRYWEGDARKSGAPPPPPRGNKAEVVPLELTVACSGIEAHKLPGVAAKMSGRKKGEQLEAEEVHAVLTVWREGEWRYFGKTEIRQHRDCPEFTKVFDFDYFPEYSDPQGSPRAGNKTHTNVNDDWVKQGQQCKLELFAKRFVKSSRGGGLVSLGRMEFTLFDLVGTPGRCKGQRLASGTGVVAVRAVVVDEAYSPPDPPPPSPSQQQPPPLPEGGEGSPPEQQGGAPPSPPGSPSGGAPTPAPPEPPPGPSTLLLLCGASELTNVPPPKATEEKISGYFLQIRRKILTGEGALFDFELVACTDVSWQAVGKQQPRWMPFEISTARLCYNDRQNPVMVELWKVSRDGFHTSLSSLETTVEALCSPAPKNADGICAGAPPAPRESDAVEPWITPLPLRPDGSETPAGQFHIAVRDSRDGAFPKGRSLSLHDRADEDFLMQMLWADDVQMSDLKDDVKNAQRLLNERKKLTVSPSTPFRTEPNREVLLNRFQTKRNERLVADGDLPAADPAPGGDREGPRRGRARGGLQPADPFHPAAPHGGARDQHAEHAG